MSEQKLNQELEQQATTEQATIGQSVTESTATEQSAKSESKTKKKIRSPWGFEEDELQAVEESMRPAEPQEGGIEDFDGRKVTQRLNNYMVHGIAVGAVVGFLLGGPIIGSTTQGMGLCMLIGMVVGVFFERKPKKSEKK